jgi:hypothetical protein
MVAFGLWNRIFLLPLILSLVSPLTGRGLPSIARNTEGAEEDLAGLRTLAPQLENILKRISYADNADELSFRSDRDPSEDILHQKVTHIQHILVFLKAYGELSHEITDCFVLGIFLFMDQVYQIFF